MRTFDDIKESEKGKDMNVRFKIMIKTVIHTSCAIDFLCVIEKVFSEKKLDYLTKSKK